VIFFPLSEMNCHVCGRGLSYSSSSNPDSDWRTQVERALNVYKASPLPLIPRTNLVEHRGQMWVSNSILNEAGYLQVEVGDIIRVKGFNDVEIFFEVDAAAKRLRGEPTNTPAIAGWWLQLVDHEGWVPDVIPVAAP
jgi:hypothetical protein